ncbi:MAG: hypothetical protein E4H01_15075 [Lysobacterales bacterium]|nr:MAG: hypothetical protein E4H01_15075 [Xanthomonadales bacterium]
MTIQGGNMSTVALAGAKRRIAERLRFGPDIMHASDYHDDMAAEIVEAEIRPLVEALAEVVETLAALTRYARRQTEIRAIT